MTAKRKTGGRYARLMGTLHRNLKTEAVGDAALGMLVRLWSYCADVGRHVLTDRDMGVIMVRDKNGPRKLKALLDAKLLEKVEGGYMPHDWFDHNPGLAGKDEPSSDASESERDQDRDEERESNVTGNVTSNVTGNVRKPDKQNQPLAPPLSDSGLRTQESLRETEDPAPAGPARRAAAKPKAPGASAAQRALEAALRDEMRKIHEAAPALSRSLAQKASKRVADHAKDTGGTIEQSAALLAASWAKQGNGNAWKLCDVPFSGRPTGQLRFGQQPPPRPLSQASLEAMAAHANRDPNV